MQDRAIVTCVDGTVATTDDGGATWTNVELQARPLAATASADGFFVVTESACTEGVDVATVAGDAIEQLSECVEIPYEPGAVAVASAEQSVYIWSGDDLVASSDGGGSWS